MKRQPKLIPEWRRSWRFFSVQADMLAVIVSGSWLAVPGDMRAAVPSEWLAIAAISLAVLGIMGRLVKQRGGHDDRQGRRSK